MHSQPLISLRLYLVLLSSKPVAKHFTIQSCPSCWGTLWSLMSRPHLSLRCGKGIGHNCSSQSFLTSGSAPRSILLSGHPPIVRLQLHLFSHLSPSCSSWLVPYCTFAILACWPLLPPLLQSILGHSTKTPLAYSHPLGCC